MERYNSQMRRGGKREGAGRKSRPLIPQVSQGIASRVLAMPADEKTGWPGEEGRWLELLNAKDERLRFDVQKYLTDRRDGKPAQGVFVGDTREGAPPLERGNLPSHFRKPLERGNLPSHFRKTAAADTGGPDKPN